MEETKKQHFVGQREDERVLYLSRRHWFPMMVMLVRNVTISCIWAAVIAAAIIGAIYAVGNEITARLVIFLVCLALMIILPTVSTTWTIFYLSLTVITDNRLIKIVQKGLFQNYTREVRLLGIQDTSYTFKNWLQSLFNYGTLVAHAASGEEGKFQVRFLPKPRAVHHYINHLNKIIHDNELDGGKRELPKFDQKALWKQ